MVRRWMVALTLMAALGGCGPGGSGQAGGDLDRLHQQARAALDRYDRAMLADGTQPRFVPVGDLTGQLGDWEPANGDNKLALLSGRVVAATALPDAPEPTGTVRWTNGVSLTVPLVSAQSALTQLAASGTGDCPGCVPLEVTAARLTTVPVQTSRGPAIAPGWEYTLKGTSVRLTRLAVDQSAIISVVQPPYDPYNAPGGIHVEAVKAPGVTSLELTVTFDGVPDPGSVPCGADYTTEAVESSNAIVVIVIEHPHADGEMCAGVGAYRTSTVALAQPLGERAVLDLVTGQPVAMTISS